MALVAYGAGCRSTAVAVLRFPTGGTATPSGAFLVRGHVESGEDFALELGNLGRRGVEVFAHGFKQEQHGLSHGCPPNHYWFDQK